MLEVVEAVAVLSDNLEDLVADRARVDFDLIVDARQFAEEGFGDLAVGRNDDFAAFAIDHIERDLLAEQDVGERFGQLLMKFFAALFVVLVELLGMLLGLDRRELRLGQLLFGGDFDVHDDAIGAGRNGERGVLHISRLLAEDGAKEALLGSEFGFALRGDFTDQNIARFHFRADPDHAVGSEVAQGFFADIRDITGDFLRAELGIAGPDFEFVDVDRSVDVLLDHALADHDGVFEIVTAPGHERDEHVPS